MKKAIYLLTVLSLIACGKGKSKSNDADTNDQSDSGSQDDPTFAFSSDISAMGLTAFSPSGGSLIGDDLTTNLFAIDTTGQKVPAGSNVYVGDIFDTKSGLVLDLSVKTAQCTGGCIILAKRDGTYQRINGGGSDSYIGENSQGDLVFKNATKLIPGSSENIPIADDWPVEDWSKVQVERMSGNFAKAVLSREGSDDDLGEDSDAVRWIDTTTGKSFQPQSCTSGESAAITDTLIFTGDCSDKVVVNAATGERLAIDNKLNGVHFSIHSHDRMIGLVQYQPEASDEQTWTIVMVDKDLNVTILDTLTLDPKMPDNSPALDTANGVLYASKDYVVVRETSQISLISLESKQKRAIFADVDAKSLSMNDHAVYFTGTKDAQAVSGQYTYGDDKTLIYDGSTFDAIEAINRF
jgi:hypothetical protein